MKYILMCGGTYQKWSTPRQLLEINGEKIIERTIRLLRENGIEDIAISSNLPGFDVFGVPVLNHQNSYYAREYNDFDGYWCDAFYQTYDPVCYIFGDVVFSEDAIKTIVNTDTDDIEFFASAPPFDSRYFKEWAEPFALKVVDTDHFQLAININKKLADNDCFDRKPIMWELWQVIKSTPLNVIDYTNYTVINDWTSDIDEPEDVEMFERVINES